MSYSDHHWAAVANGMYYDDIMIDTIKANPTAIDLKIDSFNEAIFDTGTSYMGLPKKLYNKLVAKFQMVADNFGCEYEILNGIHF